MIRQTSRGEEGEEKEANVKWEEKKGKNPSSEKAEKGGGTKKRKGDLGWLIGLMDGRKRGRREEKRERAGKEKGRNKTEGERRERR